jgi:hypothetical protein
MPVDLRKSCAFPSSRTPSLLAAAPPQAHIKETAAWPQNATCYSHTSYGEIFASLRLLHEIMLSDLSTIA